MRLGYFGPPGTFTHAALLASRRARGADAVPLPTERDTILAAAAGDVDAALVPIENSIEGGVNATLDTLVLDAPGVRIVGEEVLPVRLALIVRPDVELADVTAIVSHPQPLGQCRRFLASELPGRRGVAATSTAEAVRTVAGSEEPWAAIGTTAAAELNGCVVLREGIEDEHGNETRFWWVANTHPDGERSPDEDAAGAPGAPSSRGQAAGPWKTSIVFHGAGDASPGWLVRCLSELAFRGINLSRIESRPLKRALGHYLFVVDFEGREDDPAVADAVAGLAKHCEDVRVLGSYPAAS
jgi:prephenate dehydratase